MTEKQSYKPGEFCWVELGTTDAAAAKKFYGGLFGWKWDDMPMGDGMTYTMLKLDGREVGALYQLTGEMCGQGVPPHWMLYVSVADVAGTLERAKSLGAKVLYGPHEVPEAGHAGAIQDPQGAALGLWQPGKHIGARVSCADGTLCWGEMAAKDRKAARDFYTQALGWGTKVSMMGEPGRQFEYTEWQVDGCSAGGMLEMTSEWRGAPPHWMPYFRVADCKASAARVAGLGGSILVPPTPIPKIGEFAVATDPQSAAFSIIRLDQPA